MNNFLTHQELISEAAKSLGKPMLYWSASKIRDLEAKGEVDKLNTIYAFYKELRHFRDSVISPSVFYYVLCLFFYPISDSTSNFCPYPT